MTVGELIKQLQGYDVDQEVKIGYQPSWPFGAAISNVASNDEALDDEDREDLDEDEINTVYILTGEQDGYISKDLWK